jgi:hypothetical protein
MHRHLMLLCHKILDFLGNRDILWSADAGDTAGKLRESILRPEGRWKLAGDGAQPNHRGGSPVVALRSTTG